MLGGDRETRTYLTKVEPGKAVPLMSAEDAKDFEAFLKGDKIPQNLRERIRKYVLYAKFKWRHGIIRRMGNMVPVGDDKLENVIVVATTSGFARKIKKDEHGELYLEKPVSLEGDDNFKVFGPFPSKD
jgi:hypothetical protein